MKRSYLKFFIFAPAILLIVIVAVLAVAKNSRGGETLWRYIPSETKIFVEFDLADKNLDEYFKTNKKAKEELEKFLFDNELPVEIWQSGIEVQRVAMFVMETNMAEKKMENGWIIRAKNEVGQLNVFLSNFYYKPLDKRTAIITKSKEVMQATRDKQTFFGVDMGREKKLQGALAYGFWESDWLATNMGGSEIMKIFKNSFSAEQDSLIFWQAVLDSQQKVVWQIDLPLKLEASRQILANTNQLAGVYYFDQALTLKSGGINNLWPVISAAMSEEELDKEEIERYINDKYQTEIKELYTIFEQPFILVVQPSDKVSNLDKLVQIDKNDYVIISELAGGGDKETLTRDVEGIIKNYLAFKFPEKRQKILPDKSVGYEIVADPEKFPLMTESLAQGEIKFARVQEFELGYGWMGNKLVIFNSVELTKRVLAEAELARGSGQFRESDNVIVDAAILGVPYLDFADFVGFEIKSEGARIIINGSIVSNN
ncbi:MAG TPA: hypothetical protein P5267_01530 [Patescibacteria group bacterium]|nr:hypothetical protein [Patescibacteria group bacterium]